MHKLSTETARLISSTQIVTSVSNSVKELVENALDANATIIDVKLEKGGLHKIEVRDNGIGIKSTEIGFAAQRHFTSKISSHNDLLSLTTYGFRGEALSALCEVADVSITTRTKDELYSTVYVLDSSGAVKSKKPSHIAQGTTVTVCNLFKNIPVRKQFFSSSKKLKEQVKLTEDVLMSYAVAQPSVQFKLTNDRIIVWQKPKSSSNKSVLVHILGSLATQFVEVKANCEEKNIYMKLYYSKQFLSRKSHDRCFIVVNKRPIRDKELEKLLRLHLVKSVDDKQHSSGWPVLLLLIDVPKESIDVNVNASKTAILFTLKERIIELLSSLIHPESDDIACNKENVTISLNKSLKKTNVNELNLGNNSEDCIAPTNQLPSQEHINCRSDKVITSSSNQPHNTGIEVLPSKSVDLHSNNVQTIDTFENDSLFVDAAKLPSKEHNSNIMCESEFNKEMPIENTVCKQSTLLHSTQIYDVDVEPNFPVFTFPSQPNQATVDVSLDNYSKINQRETEGWSCGNIIKDKNGRNVEPVKVLGGIAIESRSVNSGKKRPNSEVSLKQTTLDNTIKTPQPKKPRSVFDICCDSESDQNWEKLSEKQRKHVVDVASKEYDNFVKHKKKASCTKTNKRMSFTSLSISEQEEDENVDDAVEIPLLFSMKNLSKRVKKCANISLTKHDVDIVGYLEAHKSAILQHKTDLYVINLNRLQEKVVLHNLSDKYTFSCVELDHALELTEESLGSEEMRCLKNLKCSTKTALHPDIEVLDERIISNGFKIKQSDAMWLYSSTTDIPYYGISDLREILSKIIKDNTVSLKESRPSKVVYYLQGEAARVVRSSPMQADKSDILNALKLIKGNEQSWKDVLCGSVCFHGKHIFYLMDCSF